MPKNIQENEILEYLNASTTVRGFFISTVDIFDRVVQVLIERVFLKNDFAVQSVVGPLLQDTGPLGELSVRIKLLFGLGVIPLDTYQDIDGMIKLKKMLNNDSDEHFFTDFTIVNEIESFNFSKKLNMEVFRQITVDDLDPVLSKMQLDRQQQVIKSSLALEIISLCEVLNKESPF